MNDLCKGKNLKHSVVCEAKQPDGTRRCQMEQIGMFFSSLNLNSASSNDELDKFKSLVADKKTLEIPGGTFTFPGSIKELKDGETFPQTLPNNRKVQNDSYRIGCCNPLRSGMACAENEGKSITHNGKEYCDGVDHPDLYVNKQACEHRGLNKGAGLRHDFIETNMIFDSCETIGNDVKCTIDAPKKLKRIKDEAFSSAFAPYNKIQQESRLKAWCESTHDKNNLAAPTKNTKGNFHCAKENKRYCYAIGRAGTKEGCDEGIAPRSAAVNAATDAAKATTGAIGGVAKGIGGFLKKGTNAVADAAKTTAGAVGVVEKRTFCDDIAKKNLGRYRKVCDTMEKNPDGSYSVSYNRKLTCTYTYDSEKATLKTADPDKGTRVCKRIQTGLNKPKP